MHLSSEELAAYFERIGYTNPGADPDLGTLVALHRAHALAIPFENLALHERERGEAPIRLDLPSLMDKLVHRKRGGYCFEQNTLFQAVLRTVGFEVAAHEARVRMGARSVLPRTHMVLRVDLGPEAWLADVGFGGDGLVEPVPFEGREIEHGLRKYRVVPEDALRVLQYRVQGAWTDLYAVESRPVQPIDLEVANWFTSTHPESNFVKTRTVQRIKPDARHMLRGRTLTVVKAKRGSEPEVEIRELDEEEVEVVLRELMGLA